MKIIGKKKFENIFSHYNLNNILKHTHAIILSKNLLTSSVSSILT